MKTDDLELHILVNMLCVSGRESELRGVLLGLLAPTRREPGCRRYDMYSSDQKRRFFAIETWESRKALEEHMQTPHFLAAKAKFDQLLEGELEICSLDAIAE